MVEGHATGMEEATARLTPGGWCPGRGAARSLLPQPLLCRSPAWGAPGPAGPVLARAEPAVGGVGAVAAPGPGVFAPPRLHCCRCPNHQEPFIGALCTHTGFTAPFIVI